MTSSDDARGALVDALRGHPRRAMTSTELAVRSGVADKRLLAECLAELRDRRIVTTHEVLPADPHFPPITAVALVGEGPDAALHADGRARDCAAVVQRQLLRSHRCQ